MDFKLEIKNLALLDSRGHDLQKDIVVRVTSRGSKQAGGVFSLPLSFSVTQLKNAEPSLSLLQVWVWSKAKFVNRKFLMEEVYQQFQAEQREGEVCVERTMVIEILFCFAQTTHTHRTRKK